MAKRPSIISDSDNEDPDTPPSKKSRVDRDPDSRSRGKGRVQNDESEEGGDGGEDVDHNVDYDDEKFEEAFKDRILASLNARQRVLGVRQSYCTDSYTNKYLRELLNMVSSSISKCTSSCATDTCHLLLGHKLISSLVCLQTRRPNAALTIISRAQW